MDEELERVSAMLGLLVQNAGGAVEIDNDTIQNGLPSGAGVRVTPTETGLLFELIDPNANEQ